MKIGHRDAAEHRADDAEKALIGAGQIDIFQVGAAVFDLVRGAVDGAVQMAGVFTHRARSEHVAGEAILVERESVLRSGQ